MPAAPGRVVMRLARLATALLAGGCCLAAGVGAASAAPAKQPPVKVPSAVSGPPIYIDQSSYKGTFILFGGIGIPQVASATDGTAWISWVNTQPDNGFNGLNRISLCTLLPGKSACTSPANYVETDDDYELRPTTPFLSYDRARDTLHIIFTEKHTNADGTSQTVVRDLVEHQDKYHLSDPITLGLAAGDLRAASVVDGIAHLVMTNFTTVSYAGYPVDGSLSTSAPQVSWEASLDPRSVQLGFTQDGPIIAFADGHINYMTFHGDGDFNAGTSWSGIHLVPGTSGNPDAQNLSLTSGPLGAFLVEGDGSSGTHIFSVEPAGFTEIGKPLAKGNLGVIAEGADGSLAVAVLGGNVDQASVRSTVTASPDPFHLTTQFLLNSAKDAPCQNCQPVLSLSSKGNGVEVYSVPGGLHAQRFESPAGAQLSYLHKTSKRVGTISASLESGCNYSPTGIVHVTIGVKRTKGVSSRLSVRLDKGTQHPVISSPFDDRVALGTRKAATLHITLVPVTPPKGTPTKGTPNSGTSTKGTSTSGLITAITLDVPITRCPTL